MAKNLIKNKKTKKEDEKMRKLSFEIQKTKIKIKKGTTTNDSRIDVFENSKICQRAK